MKKLILVFVLVASGIAAVVLWTHNNLDRIVKSAIIKYGSELTQTDVEVGAVEIDVVSGKCVIRHFKVGNPKGFKTAHALKVDQFEVDIDPTTIANKVIEIQKIRIDSPNIIYEKGDELTNFDAIQKNVAEYIKAQTKSQKDEEGKKLIIEHFDITNAKAAASADFMNGKTLQVNLPDVHIVNLGQSKGGIPPSEVGAEIVTAIKKQLSASLNFDSLAKSFVEGAKATVDAAKDVAKDAANKVKSIFN